MGGGVPLASPSIPAAGQEREKGGGNNTKSRDGGGHGGTEPLPPPSSGLRGCFLQHPQQMHPSSGFRNSAWLLAQTPPDPPRHPQGLGGVGIKVRSLRVLFMALPQGGGQLGRFLVFKSILLKKTKKRHKKKKKREKANPRLKVFY